MVYSISYDLRAPGRDYNSLYDAIKSYSTWWHQTESVWLIVTKDSAVDVRSKLIRYLDSNDKLFVVALQKEWAAVGFSDNEYGWLGSISDENWK